MALSKQEERTDSREPNLRQTPDSHGWKVYTADSENWQTQQVHDIKHSKGGGKTL